MEDDSVLGSIAAAAAQAAVAAVAQFDLGEVAAAAAASAATAATLAALQASGLNGCINPKNPRQAAATALQLSGVKLIENETDENSFDLQRHVDAIRMPSPPVTLEPKQTAFLEDCLRICHRSFEPEGDSFLSCVTFQPETSETGRHPLLIAPRELAGLTWEVPQDRLIEMSLFDEERYNGDRLLINDKQLLQLYAAHFAQLDVGELYPTLRLVGPHITWMITEGSCSHDIFLVHLSHNTFISAVNLRRKSTSAELQRFPDLAMCELGYSDSLCVRCGSARQNSFRPVSSTQQLLWNGYTAGTTTWSRVGDMVTKSRLDGGRRCRCHQD